jgi:iron complex transport system substrate-binding protein
LTLNAPPQRIVSLTPSNTEILFALGLEPRIVGVTTACDYPPQATKKPKIGDFKINTERVIVQTPDLVVAVEGLNRQAIEVLERTNTPVFTVNAQSVGQSYDAVRLIGQATGQDREAQTIVAKMQADLNKVRDAANKMSSHPTVLMVYGVNPLYTTGPGSFIDEIIRMAGGKNVLDKPAPGDKLSPEQVVALQPDVIICSAALVSQLKQIPGFAKGVPAIRNNHLYQPKSEAVLVRPSPRMPAALAELSQYLRSITAQPVVKP